MTTSSRSLPSRERGLKFYGDKGFGLVYPVAPFTGAWIEIGCGTTRWTGPASRSLHGSVD